MYSFSRVRNLPVAVEQKIYYALRIASAMCFLGHGAFGIITKPIWLNYFGVFGIGAATSYSIMPWLGAMDICMGILLLVYPVRAAVIWLVIWGLFTAALRPMSGEPVAEFIERAGNFGAPLAWLLLSDPAGSMRGLLAPVRPVLSFDPGRRKLLISILRPLSCCILLGHGWLTLSGKAIFVNQFRMAGFVHPGIIAQYAGVFEVIAAGVVLLYPLRSVVMVLLVWKITSELFYPHYEIFEWIERGGSYGCLLALGWLSGVNLTSGQPAGASRAGRLIFKNSPQRIYYFFTGKKQLSK